VTGKRLLKRFLAVFLMALGLLVFLNAVQANAAIRKVDSRSMPQPATIHSSIA
jgi:hypothetical protein